MEENKNVNVEEVLEEISEEIKEEVDLEEAELTEEESGAVGGGATYNIFGIC